MALVRNTAASRQAAWKAANKAAAFLNINVSGRTNVKLGAIPLRESNATEAKILSWIGGDADKAATLKDKFILSYNKVDDSGLDFLDEIEVENSGAGEGGAIGYLNFALPTATSSARLGSITLKHGVQVHEKMDNWLSQSEDNLARLQSMMSVVYRSAVAKDKPSSEIHLVNFNQSKSTEAVKFGSEIIHQSTTAQLLNSIAATTADYRNGMISPEHIACWINQFDHDVRLLILQEMDHILKKTYFSLGKVSDFLQYIIQFEELAGTNPLEFWRSVQFLNIQGGGSSQREMLGMFNQLLKQTYDIEINQYKGIPNSFVYLDDAIFTGHRVFEDIKNWITSDASPTNSKIYIVTIALHSNAPHYVESKIQKLVKEIGKNIVITWWVASNSYYENRPEYINSSDVLRLTSIPNVLEVQQYVSGMEYKPSLRVASSDSNGKNDIFLSEKGRHLLEQEFFKAGVKIRRECPNLPAVQSPLGQLGFGSLIVTFRNCPNNAPLALWTGNPWYPLFPRITNNQTLSNNIEAKYDF